MKKYLLVFTLLLVPMFSFAQQKDTTKMKRFVSKTGVIIKQTEYNLPNISAILNTVRSKVITVESGGEKKYFFMIFIEMGEYDDLTTMIAEEDITELIKALKSLKQSVTADVKSSPDYLVNKFVTEEGFQVGYRVSEEKITWFIVLENSNRIFLRNVDIIENALTTALEKIDTLK